MAPHLLERPKIGKAGHLPISILKSIFGGFACCCTRRLALQGAEGPKHSPNDDLQHVGDIQTLKHLLERRWQPAVDLDVARRERYAQHRVVGRVSLKAHFDMPLVSRRQPRHNLFEVLPSALAAAP